MSDLEKSRKNLASHLTRPLLKVLVKTPLTPNAITWAGFLITLVAVMLAIFENFLAAGVVLLVAGMCDMLDGALARLTGKTSRFGAILDSTLDRLSEGAVFLGLLVVFLRAGEFTGAVLAGLAMLFSIMVSYLRARMEGAGIACGAGFFTRPERVILISLGLLLGSFDHAMVIALAIVVFFSFVTMVERLVYAWNRARE